MVVRAATAASVSPLEPAKTLSLSGLWAKSAEVRPTTFLAVSAAKPAAPRVSQLVALMPAFHMADIDVLAMYPSRRHLSSRVRVMIDYLVEVLGGVAPWDRS